jgi:putative transcriptional regulator
VDPNLVRPWQTAARTFNQEAISLLLLRCHLVVGDFTVAAECWSVAHCGVSFRGVRSLHQFACGKASRQDIGAMTLMLSRRVLLSCGGLLLCPAAWATPEDASKPTFLAGQLLIATDAMGDPRFRHSVILMAKHDKTGALGVAVNRPIEEMSLTKLMGLLGQDAAGIAGTVTVYSGGPVEPNVGFIVHSADYHADGTIDIDGRVALTTNPAALRDIGHGTGPKQSLIAFGYAGWGPHQLENEIAQDAWFTVPEEPRFVFDMDRDKLWDEMQKRRTYPL